MVTVGMLPDRLSLHPSVGELHHLCCDLTFCSQAVVGFQNKRRASVEDPMVKSVLGSRGEALRTTKRLRASVRDGRRG